MELLNNVMRGLAYAEKLTVSEMMAHSPNETVRQVMEAMHAALHGSPAGALPP